MEISNKMDLIAPTSKTTSAIPPQGCSLLSHLRLKSAPIQPRVFRNPFKFACLVFLCLSTSHTLGQTNDDLAKLERDLENYVNGPQLAFVFIDTLIGLIDLSVDMCVERKENVAAITAAKNKWAHRNGIADVRTVLANYDAAAGQEHLTNKERQNAQQRAELQSIKDADAVAMCTDLPLFLDNNADFDDERKQSVAVLKEFNSQFVAPEKLTAVENPNYRSLASMGVMPGYPDYDVIPTEFRCYSQQHRSSYTQPDFVLQTRIDGSYQSSFGAGRFERLPESKPGSGSLRWTGALQNSALSKIRFNRFGQSILFESLSLNGKESDYQCYQQGARENDALVSYRLKDPQPGSYQCTGSGGRALGELVLHENRQYSMDGQLSAYRLNLQGEDPTKGAIEFGAGLLDGSKATFSEELNNGARRISFNLLNVGGTEVAEEGVLECIGAGDPITRQKYGTESSLKPPKGSGGLSGLYALRGRLDKTKRSNYEFYYFYKNGYVHVGAPDTTLDHKICTMTEPNGSESCASYSKKGDTITVGSKTLDFKDLTPVKTNVKTLEGRFSNNTYWEIGSCLLDACSTFYDESSISFNKAGQFIKDSSSQATGITVNPVDYAGSSKAGNYKINKHTIELRYNSGKVEEHFFAMMADNKIQLFGWSYMKDSSD